MQPENKSTASTAVGLDIGTSRIVSARRNGNDYTFESQLNAFLEVPHTRLTQDLFERERIPHQVSGSEMIVFGNQATKFANLFHRETRRPMRNGLLNPDEAQGLHFLRRIVSSLLEPEKATKKAAQVCFSVPAPPLHPGGPADDIRYHQATLRQALTEFGVALHSVDEGLAVVLAELEKENFTGIGVSCGAGMCNVCLAYLSVPIFSFSIPKGGDFIDQSAAAVTGEIATRIRDIKEKSFHFNGYFTERHQQAIGVYYDEMIQTLAAGLKEAFQQAKRAPRFDQPIPLVIAGGSALPAGFTKRFETVLKGTEFPIELSEVRLSADPLFSTAKGALVAALAGVTQ
ncbi:MAG: hypothetical protein ACRD8O_05010 [Bryobacteraceae bacterium]